MIYSGHVQRVWHSLALAANDAVSPGEFLSVVLEQMDATSFFEVPLQGLEKNNWFAISNSFQRLNYYSSKDVFDVLGLHGECAWEIEKLTIRFTKVILYDFPYSLGDAEECRVAVSINVFCKICKTAQVREEYCRKIEKRTVFLMKKLLDTPKLSGLKQNKLIYVCWFPGTYENKLLSSV